MWVFIFKNEGFFEFIKFGNWQLLWKLEFGSGNK